MELQEAKRSEATGQGKGTTGGRLKRTDPEETAYTRAIGLCLGAITWAGYEPLAGILVTAIHCMGHLC